MFEVLEHIEEDKNAVKKVYDLLGEKGTFLFSVPAKAKLWGANDIISGHIKRYEKEELINLLNQTGFEIIQLISYGFPWLNIAKHVRDKMAGKRLKKSSDKSKKVLTGKSGLNVSGRIPLLEIFFNKYFLFLPMRISSLFNNMDLAEGYLCLATKKN